MLNCKKFKLIALFTMYFILLGLISNGCSHGGSSPTEPASLQDQTELSQEIDSFPVAITGNLSDSGMTGTGVLGAFEVNIDPANMTGEITPFRISSAIKDSFIVDITNFLSIAPCKDCLKLIAVALGADQNIECTFTIRHPFKPGNLGNPPSASNRLDLHIFDVFGIVHFPGNTTSIGTKLIASDKIINPDGYTDSFDSRIDPIFPTEANLHPYMVMSLDPTNGNYNPSSPTGFTNIISPTGHNVLPMGCAPIPTTFRIHPDDAASINFALVVTAAYGQSATKATVLPTYYLPEFNRKEAWRVGAAVTSNTMFESEPSSSCAMQIEVWDWNHGATIDPEMVNKDSIRASSNVASVTVEIPGVTDSAVSATGPVSGDGRTTPLLYQASIFNELGAARGTKTGLVKVTDSRETGLNTGGIGDAIARDGVTFFELSEFATYQVFEVDVLIPDTVAVIDTNPDPPFVQPSQSVSLDGTRSYAYHADIISYEWDMDYDGITFDVEKSIPIVNDVKFVNKNKDTMRDYTVALRVTDNNTPTPGTAISTRIVTVRKNRPPIADLKKDKESKIRKGQTINFTAFESMDPDEDPITYEWDFDYEEGNFTADAFGPVASKTYNSMGLQIAALRICDDATPSSNIVIEQEPILVLPKFENPVCIENTMVSREFQRDTHNHIVVTDPVTGDIYIGYTGNYTTTAAYERMRIQRSTDGGLTWSAPGIPKNDNYATGDWGMTMVFVRDPDPKLFVFWISEAGNSTAHTADGNNIKLVLGTPHTDDNGVDWHETTDMDISLFDLSGNPWIAPPLPIDYGVLIPAEGHSDYHVNSDPSDIVAVADPNSAGTVYLAYIEEAAVGSSVNRSVRVLKTTNISGYPSYNAVNFVPLTPNHVDSTTTVTNFDSVDIAVDNSSNLYVTWDDNATNMIEIRKYSLGVGPGNASQIVASSATNTLSFPRIAIASDGSPVVVYNDSNFPGGTNGINQVALSHGINTLPTMSAPIRVNTYASRTSHHYKPSVAIDQDEGLIFVSYEDRRTNASNGEIFWTVLDAGYGTILPDEIIHTPTPTIQDFDVHSAMYTYGGNVGLVVSWEEYNEDTWVAIAR
jgi:hypothetical protein